ncbi:zincin-like metallopeptidase domain-containing protein [Moritella viscosa]
MAVNKSKSQKKYSKKKTTYEKLYVYMNDYFDSVDDKDNQIGLTDNQIKVGQHKKKVAGEPRNFKGKPYNELNTFIIALTQTDKDTLIPQYHTLKGLESYFNDEEVRKILPEASKKLTTRQILTGLKKNGNIHQKYSLYSKKANGEFVKMKKNDFLAETEGMTDKEKWEEGYYEKKLRPFTAVYSIDQVYEHLPDSYKKNSYYCREFERLKNVTMSPEEHSKEVYDLALEIQRSNDIEYETIENRAQSAYNYGTDGIKLANYETYYNAESYAVITIHETKHSTGHPRKLNRFKYATDDNGDPKVGFFKPRSDKDYAEEECTVELSTAVTAKTLGIKTTSSAHKGYYKGWWSKIKDDPKALKRVFDNGLEAGKYVLNDLYTLRVAETLQNNDLLAKDVQLNDNVLTAAFALEKNSSKTFTAIVDLDNPDLIQIPESDMKIFNEAINDKSPINDKDREELSAKLKLDLQKYSKAKVEVSGEKLREKEQERKLAQEQALDNPELNDKKKNTKRSRNSI